MGKRDKNKKKMRKKTNIDKNDDYLMRSPSLNPDDIEIGDDISPEERLLKKEKEDKTNKHDRN